MSFCYTGDGWCVIHEAAQGGWTKLVNDLLDAGGDPNVKLGFGTALHIAARSGLLRGVLSTLLTRGADKDALGRHGTPLVVAANAGHLALVTLLLTADAEIRGGYQSTTALIQAATQGHV